MESRACTIARAKYAVARAENELITLSLKLEELRKFRKWVGAQQGTAEFTHSLRIIDAALPFADRLISIAEDAKESFQRTNGSSESDQNWRVRHYITMETQVTLAKGILAKADSAAALCRSYLPVSGAGSLN